MTVADRIKALRIEKGITQTELAKKLGNKDKSTISKIESKGNDISLKDINRIAEALGTTASHLMGWDVDYFVRPEGFDEEIGELLIMARKSPDIRELISRVGRLTPEQRNSLLMIVRSMQPDAHHEL